MANKNSKGKGNRKAGNPCLCGCGAKVRGHFAQGHDQRFRGFAVRAQAGLATKAEQAAVKAAVAAGLVLHAVREANQRVLRAS